MNNKPLTILIADECSNVNLDAVKRALEKVRATLQPLPALPSVFAPLPIPTEFTRLLPEPWDFPIGSFLSDFIRVEPPRYLDVTWVNDDERRRQRNVRKRRRRKARK